MNMVLHRNSDVMFLPALVCLCLLTVTHIIITMNKHLRCYFHVDTNTTTTTNIHWFNGLFQDNLSKPYQKGKTSLDLNEVRENGVLGCGGISWAISKQSAPHCRQITTSKYLITQFLHVGYTSWCPTNSVKALKT